MRAVVQAEPIEQGRTVRSSVALDRTEQADRPVGVRRCRVAPIRVRLDRVTGERPVEATAP